MQLHSRRSTKHCMRPPQVLLQEQGPSKYPEAQKLYRSALDLDIELFGAEHPDSANTMSSLGVRKVPCA